MPTALRVAVPLAAFALALWFLREELVRTPPAAIWEALRDTEPVRVLGAAALTAASFGILTLYDALGLRHADADLPYRKTAFASATSFGISQSVGFPLLTGVPIRYRLYTSWGLSALQVSKVVGFYAVNFWLGLFTLLGGLLLLAPGTLAGPLGLSETPVRVGGGVALALVLAYVSRSTLSPPRSRTVGLGFWRIEVPEPRLALLQPLLGPLDWLAAAGVLYVLLPAGAPVPFSHLLAAFLAAHVLGVLSRVPAGLGVVEVTLVALIGDRVGGGELLAALVSYRVVYHLLPLLAAALGLGAYELRHRRQTLDRMARGIHRLALPVVPTAVAAATFLAGSVLLLTGSLPGDAERLSRLGRVLPLPAIEISHLGASLLGVTLLIVARGLQRRLDGAYHVAVVVLGVGIVLALGRGVDYWEAGTLAGALVALVAARGRFDRKAALASERFGVGWTVALGCVLITAVWLGFLAYRHVPFRADAWWAFALHGDAPRFLRASVAAAVLLGLFGVSRLLGPSRPRVAPPDEADLDRAAGIASASARSSAALALLGDKQLIFSESGDAFLMYGVEGRTWVALGDPVGPTEEWEELVWTFAQRARRFDDYPVFYHVGGAHLGLYAELGMGLLKLGEEARVPLSGFSLEGGARKDLRRALRGLEREGCTFEVVPAPAVSPLMDELRSVSDRWLAQKGTSEKGFSLGFFEPRYVKRFPVATVRREGELIAFANLWLGAPGTEMSPDMMRYVPEAPKGVMDYLFAQLMLWGQREGYAWFQLGVAPLSGLESRESAPVWERLGSFVFRFGDQFYGFEGLRRFKEKFDPVWESTYLAAPGGLALPRVLANVTTLISGGVSRLFTR